MHVIGTLRTDLMWPGVVTRVRRSHAGMVHHVMFELREAGRGRASLVLAYVYQSLGPTQEPVIESAEQITLENNRALSTSTG